MDCSIPGFPVRHQLPELAQTLARHRKKRLKEADRKKETEKKKMRETKRLLT